MKTRKILAGIWSLFVVVAMLGIATPAAADEGDPVWFTGTVTGIDEAGGLIHVQVLEISEFVVYHVQVPAGFNFNDVHLFDTVDVTGTLYEDNFVIATTITIHPGEGDDLIHRNGDRHR
jgi:hypothetical protein